MRSIGKVVTGLMMVWALGACGGTVEETTEPTPPPSTPEVTAQYACPIDRPCPGTTTCVNGMCRDCSIQPCW
jgi:hypothetical protein